jgi:S1-C subfamily serine protease
MGLRVTCSACGESYPVDDSLRGKRLRCRKCESPLLVPASRSRPAREEEDEEDLPRRREAADRRPRSREEESNRPRRKAAPTAAGQLPIILAGAGAGVLLLVGLVVGALYALGGRGKADPVVQAKEQEKAPLPAALSQADLARVKQATAYLRVNLPTGAVAEGTGFFAEAPGIIMTNAHVLGMLNADSLPPRNVAVVVHSGLPEEFQLTGQLLGVDRTNDLAVLRVDGPRLPTPLQVESAGKLTETQKVYIFGFPLGARLGRNITVSESSVSALRLDESGTLHQVQVNGGMHPGNSGGPVTDSRGVVVGVSVAGIRGTQINFAIPGDFVKEVVEGRPSGFDVGAPYTSGNQTHLPVRVTTLDPLGRVREVKLEVWTGNPGKPRPADGASLPGDGPRQSVAASGRDGSYTAHVPLPALAAGDVYWAQPVLLTASGARRRGPAQVVPFEPALVLDRKGVLLQFKGPAAPVDRTLRMVSNTTMTFIRGTDSRSLGFKMDGDVLEQSKPDVRGLGTGVVLTIGRPVFTREIAGRVLQAPPDFTTYLSKFSPSFLVDANNRAKERGNRVFTSVPAGARETVESFFETVCNTWEITTIPFPNRMVSAGDRWPARVPMLTLVEGKREVQWLHLVCTYEGTRTAAGRSEAFVRLDGVVRGRGALANTNLGKVSGHALFDVEKGFISKVKVTITTEVDSGGAGLRLVVTDDSIVERVEGDTRGIRRR